MAARGPRTGDEQPPDAIDRARDEGLVRICDLAGRPRGTGFVADHHGTVITSHEAVDGLARLVLHAPGDRSVVVGADAVTLLPAADLALVRTRGLDLDPLPITVRDRVGTGTYVRIAAGGWREARVLGSTAVTYTATDRFHLLGEALELAIGTAGADALRLGGGAAGGPVLDVSTGTVIGVVGTALHGAHPAARFAVPLRTPGVRGALAALLARNAATVPAYGTDLNPAGVLELTATSVGSDGPGATPASGTGEESSTTVERTAVLGEFESFVRGPAAVLGLVGPPGSGRTTELAALAARRTGGAEPAPTLWLRGADLLTTDASVADAAARALERAGRIVAASREGVPGDSEVLPPGGYGGELGDIGPERLASLARDTGRPLLLLLDGPEEMPSALAHRLPDWTAGTAEWLGETGARLVVACRPEYWEQAGAHFPAELLHRAAGARPEPLLPSCVRLGDLTEEEARRIRTRARIPEGTLRAADARHPLTLRLLAEVRAAVPDAPAGCLDRHDVLGAHLDLMCLRVAVRLAAANGVRGTAVRRLAAQVSGRVHEAARRCLGPGQGQLDRESFEAVFPWGPAPGRRSGRTTGWASAVLTERLLVPAGNGYRFAHEELADWIQGTHLDLDAALHALVHRSRDTVPPAAVQEPTPSGTEAERVPAQRTPPPAGTGPRAVPGPVTGSGAPRRRRSRGSRPAVRTAPGLLAVPRHRIGPVVEALLIEARQQGAPALTPRLEELVHALDALVPDAPAPAEDPVWWAARLLGDVVLRLPDATPYTGVLRLLAERIVRWRAEGRGVPAEFGPAFWEALPLSGTERLDLLRSLVVADEAPHQADLAGPAPAGTVPGETALTGRVRLGTTPSGTVPGETALTGRVRLGTTPSGTVPGDTAPMDRVRLGTAPDGAPSGDAARDAGATAGAAPEGAAAADGAREGAATDGVGPLDEVPDGWAAALRRTPGNSRTSAGTGTRAGTGTSGGSCAPGSSRTTAGTGTPAGTGTSEGTGTPAGSCMPESSRTKAGARMSKDSRAPEDTRTPRYLDAVARLLAADPTGVAPHLISWFDDDRPLPATPHATVATAAQALLYAHRRRALDDLAEALVDSAHRRADELLAALAEEEPSAVCRAVDRWAHDTRPARRVAAVAYGLRAAPHVRTEADRALLRYAALALLARPADCTLHGGALGLLVRDPRSRAAYLPQALERFAAGDAQMPARALVPALTTHPDPVIAAFRARLRQPGADPAEALRTLADVTTPALAHRVAALVREMVELRPEAAAHMAAYVDRRLAHGSAARTALFPLVTGLLIGCPAPVRAALATVLAAPGSRASQELRRELLDLLLAHERDPAVLGTLLRAAAEGMDRRGEEPTRELVHRTGRLLVRTPAGATAFDRGLVELARKVPGFAAVVAAWLAGAPEEWAGVVGPSTRRMIENLAGVRVPA
ncbi:serine protease [Streptomyces sp. NBC_01571]|uniref:trypsin-like peptidase domain-containing protein n=1 Tax=Streptomyces sp. NBC_01571 TaxID=2975883 RepID=UPI00224F1B5B|nr:trypsin-like peptidase domain-containing protein [Streptomyces sp. NBC_01571]MCX4577864.1 serine protease [Streptomyces sp. NBC_01571]